ncbi:hypothetical protein ACKWTF_014392 [Chironomus riparius]
MTKRILILLCMTLTFRNSLASSKIECTYNTFSYTVLGLIYQCDVKNDLKIFNDKSAVISTIDGVHEGTKGNNDVIGFYANQKTIQVFPKNLEKFFKNLKALWIANCELKEIFQSDLRKFPKLAFILLPGNNIEVIEEGLFAYNPDLEIVGFVDNNLIHVDPNVFDNLNKLSYFWFNNASCVNIAVHNMKDKVKMALNILRMHCVSSEVVAIDENLKNLKVDSVNVKVFAANIKALETRLKNSKFSKFRPLMNNFENLGDYSSCGKGSGVSDGRLEYVRLNTSLFASRFGGNIGLPYSKDFNRNSEPFDDDFARPTSNLNPTNNQSNREVFYKYNYSSRNPFQYIPDMPIAPNIKASQCDELDDLKASQSNIENSLSELKASQNDQKVAINQLDSKITIQLENIQKFSQNSLKSMQGSLKISHNYVISSIGGIKNTTNELKASQSEIMDSLLNLKNSQDDAEALIKSNEKKIEDLNEKLLNLDEKLENLSEKMEKIENKLGNFAHKVAIDVEKKMKGVEMRIAKKIEEVLKNVLAEKL